MKNKKILKWFGLALCFIIGFAVYWYTHEANFKYLSSPEYKYSHSKLKASHNLQEALHNLQDNLTPREHKNLYEYLLFCGGSIDFLELKHDSVSNNVVRLFNAYQENIECETFFGSAYADTVYKLKIAIDMYKLNDPIQTPEKQQLWDTWLPDKSHCQRVLYSEEEQVNMAHDMLTLGFLLIEPSAQTYANLQAYNAAFETYRKGRRPLPDLFSDDSTHFNKHEKG